MFTERQISAMLGQIARQDDVEIGPEQTVGRVAALAHVAEQYGYAYDRAHRTGHNGMLILVRMYRDPHPAARAREAATIAAHPQAGNGGTVPGMRPGTVKPLPEAQEPVARLKDRIMLDVMAEAANKRQKLFAWGPAEPWSSCCSSSGCRSPRWSAARRSRRSWAAASSWARSAGSGSPAD